MSNTLIFFDTETTGMNKQPGGDLTEGHRIIEVAFLKWTEDGELIPYQQYFNPQQEISPEAFAVHGLNADFLKDYGLFGESTREMLNFIKDSILVAHNADFDKAFLNAELKKVGLRNIEHYCADIVDTLKIARKKFPGQRNSLDALCQRYQISIQHRRYHGALKDCYLLYQVYKNLCQKQQEIFLDSMGGQGENSAMDLTPLGLSQDYRPWYLSAEELKAHEDFMQKYCT